MVRAAIPAGLTSFRKGFARGGRRLLALSVSVLLISTSPFVHCYLALFAQEPPSTGAAISSMPPSPQAPVSTPLVLQDGTPVKLSINRSVSSADAHVGEEVEFVVMEDVVVSGMVVAQRGAVAVGNVTEAVPRRRMGRAGKLEIVLDYVRLADTQTASVRAVKDAKGKSRKGEIAVGIVATGLLFWPAAPFFLLMRGKDITVPIGAEVTAYVNGDHTLEAAKFAAKSLTAETPPAPAVPTVDLSGTLEVQSKPAPAAVYADGLSVGNTPVNMKLGSGDHQIRVVLAGYKEWLEVVHIQERVDSHITANLEAAPN